METERDESKEDFFFNSCSGEKSGEYWWAVTFKRDFDLQYVNKHWAEGLVQISNISSIFQPHQCLSNIKVQEIRKEQYSEVSVYIV